MIKFIILILFFISIFILFGYRIFLFSKLARYQLPSSPNQKNTNHQDLPVSVIICAHDEENNLASLLPLLYNQEYPDYEIIVVNDSSNDHTLDLLLAEKQKHPEKLKIVNIWKRVEHVHGKKYGLTLGIRAAKNDVLLLTDADCRPASPLWIKYMAAPFHNPDISIVLGYSPYFRRKGLLNAFIRFETWLTGVFYLSAALAGRPYMGVGRNLAYRKSFFMANKGYYPFQALKGGDDDLFINRHAKGDNTSIILSDKALVYSLPKLNWKDFLKQKKRHLGIGKYYKKYDKIFIGGFFISQGLFWITFFPLLLVWGEPYFAGSGFILRIFVFYNFFKESSKKLQTETFNSLIPLLEFIYVVYYVSTGVSALFTKRFPWK